MLTDLPDNYRTLPVGTRPANPRVIRRPIRTLASHRANLLGIMLSCPELIGAKSTLRFGRTSASDDISAINIRRRRIGKDIVNEILLGKTVPNSSDVFLHARYGNRHGMIAGATGTGKSVSLMVMAEGFSRLGVPVFLADVKGDLAGLSQAAVISDKLKPRLQKLGLTNFTPAANPVIF
ncbi:MAG TPA: helicase HerA-like domain-containing protein, partial [Nevskia sp.]|nr:helicase HerA-like domain-containing protein [Nevskia sp.]